MSYCRFLEADAYIYDDVSYGIICCMCWMEDANNFVSGYDYDMMLDHIAKHRAAGDYIPTLVDEELIKERDCDHTFIKYKNLSPTCSKCRRRESV